MRIYHQKNRIKLVLLSVAIFFAAIALWQINQIVQQLKKEEQKKVQIWASAISRKADLVKQTEEFFNQVQIEERNRVSLFVEAQKEIMRQPIDADYTFITRLSFENNNIPVIITDENNVIQVVRNVDVPDSVTVLQGELLEEFLVERPFPYSALGMNFRLYYKESKIYSDLRNVLNNLTTSFLSEIADNSVFVPVIIVDETKTNIIASGNIDTQGLNNARKLNNVIERMASENTPIEILLPNEQTAYVYYEKSALLKSLQYYPLIYLFLTSVFILVAYSLFRTARSSEQNQIWVGMSKETAHQLGTPISSLMAWLEYMKLKGLDDEMTVEIDKDINRLETIAQRFSKIGSIPELKPDDIVTLVEHSISYLKTRSSKKVNYTLNLPNRKIIIPLNNYLFEWVIENLVKNAIDAMGGVGDICIDLHEDDHSVYIDITDTGKGIPRRMFKTIFNPGFSTKSRGWGLGLSLTKRIIKDYHKGKVFVKSSTVGKGTTFRIILRKG